MRSKSDIRAECLRIRDAISESYRLKAAATAAEILTNYPGFKQSENIACYCAHKKEFETIPLIETIWQLGKKCYLPVLCEGKILSFVRYDKGDMLELNQFGIPEPDNYVKRIPSNKLDMVLMPLVAFDTQGRRLGMGGGYYDRTFAFTHNQVVKPYLVGVAFDSQLVEELPSDPWDINMHSVITENGIKQF